MRRYLTTTLILFAVCFAAAIGTLIVTSLPNYLGFLIGWVLATLANLGLVVAVGYALFSKRYDKGARTQAQLSVAFIVGLIGTASWASWVLAAWEEYQAQQTLPIINIAGLPSLPCTVIVVAILATTAFRAHKR